MLNLLKSDFYRIIKDKIVIISLIIVLALAILACGTNFLLQLLLSSSDQSPENIEFIQSTICGRSMFLNSFNPASNAAIIIPIMSSIMICKEYSFGTIRNKVISGNKRYQIYLSTFITQMLFGLFFITLYSLVTLCVGSLLCGYGFSFNGEEVVFVLRSFIMGLIIYMFFLSLMIFISSSIKSIGFSIVIYVGIILGLSIGTSVISSLVDYSIIKTILSLTPFEQYNLLAMGSSNYFFIIKTILCNIAFMAAFSIIGAVLFIKHDIK